MFTACYTPLGITVLLVQCPWLLFIRYKKMKSIHLVITFTVNVNKHVEFTNTLVR